MIFSGIGTSLLLSEHCLLALLGKLYDMVGIDIESMVRAIFNSVAAILLFGLFYFIGLFANKIIRKKKDLYKRKGTA